MLRNCLLAGAFVVLGGASSPATAEFEGATPPPVSGQRLSAPDSILPADVLARVELLRESAEVLRRYMGKRSRKNVSYDISSYTEVREHTANQRLEESQKIARQIEADASVHTSGDLRRLLDFALEEFLAYDLQVQEVIAMSRVSAWNVALLLYVEEAQPLVIDVLAIAGQLAETQARASEESAELLTRASFLVIAMALTMGLLSAGSLFVSYRLEQQVHNVMARAKRLGQYEIEERVGKGGDGRGLSRAARHAATPHRDQHPNPGPDTRC